MMVWRVKVEACKKPSAKELVKRLKYDNLLGLDEALRHGLLNGGKIGAEMLEMKRQFPHEVLLYRYMCKNRLHKDQQDKLDIFGFSILCELPRLH